jgi:hypothetical protein
LGINVIDDVDEHNPCLDRWQYLFYTICTMDADDDAIGLVRAHRWMGVTAQARRLKEAGCKRIFDLDKEARADMERIAGRRRALLVYAFLLASPDKTRGMWADFTASLERIEKRQGVVVDVGTGLDSTKEKRAAFLDVVRGQVRRHNQGEKSGENHPPGTPGRQQDKFSAGDRRLARDIWKDANTYPTWDSTRPALARLKATNTGRPFTVERAYKLWGARPRPKPKD